MSNLSVKEKLKKQLQQMLENQQGGKIKHTRKHKKRRISRRRKTNKRKYKRRR